MPDSISFDRRLVVPEDVMTQTLPDGESVFINLESEQYFGLDEVGTRMFEVLTSSDSIGDAYETLLAEYDVEPDRLREDVEALVRSLLDQGLVSVADDAR